MDIEIAATKRFVIHIENKIRAGESKDQTGREWRDLQERAKELEVPDGNYHALFLTLLRLPAENKNFRPIGWNRIAKVLDKFAAAAKPPNITLFARHYAAAVAQAREDSGSLNRKKQKTTILRSRKR